MLRQTWRSMQMLARARHSSPIDIGHNSVYIYLSIFLILPTAVTWLEYDWIGLNTRKSINQSIYRIFSKTYFIDFRGEVNTIHTCKALMLQWERFLKNIMFITISVWHNLTKISGLSCNLWMRNTNLLFVCLGFNIPLENFSLIWRRHHYQFCLFVFIFGGFSSNSRLFHRWRTANFDLCSVLMAIEHSIACHTYCDTGHRFKMVISEDPWHSHLLPGV